MSARPSCLFLTPTATNGTNKVMEWMRGIFQISFGNGEYEFQLNVVDSGICDLTLKVNRFLEDDDFYRNMFKLLVKDFVFACRAISEAKTVTVQQVQFSGDRAREIIKPDTAISPDTILSFTTVRLCYE